MIGDDKDYMLNRGNLTQPIQRQLSQKQKHFFPFFFCVFKISIKFYTFTKEDDNHSWCISEIKGLKTRG